MQGRLPGAVVPLAGIDDVGKLGDGGGSHIIRTILTDESATDSAAKA